MTTADLVMLQMEGGARVVLQRVPPALDARSLAQALGGEVITDWRRSSGGPRVLDARRLRSFDGWDDARVEMGRVASASPLVVMLDVASADALAGQAPHLVSWAGGIWLPPDHPLRGVQTEEEVRQGERRLAMLLESDEFATKYAGQEVAVDLRTGIVFVRVGPSTPLDVAKENLDEGIVFVDRVPG